VIFPVLGRRYHADGHLLSLSQLKLPVKVIVFQQWFARFIELEQKSTGFLRHRKPSLSTRTSRRWPGIGIKGVRIEDPAEVQEKLAEALAHRGPVLIDAVVNRLELAMPPKVTTEMGRLHAYMLKAVSQWACRRGRRARRSIC